MDYYSILGVKREASLEDIKRAYRSLAMKHHPDRGGDQAEFQKIQEAYSVVGDQQKRRAYDQQGSNPFSQNINEEMFSQFFRNPFGFNRTHRNPNISVNIEISLEDAFRGKNIDAEIGLSNGTKKLISISIPSGVETGMNIRYPGMGETTHTKLPPGDLIVNVIIAKHKIWTREGDHLIYEKTISAFDAIIGCNLNLTTIDGKMLSISIPPGTQPETILSCKGEGMPNVHTKQRGNLLIKVKVVIPKNLSTEEIIKVEQLRNEIQLRSS